MFAKLTGKLDSVGTDTCVLDVNGVGYLLACSTRTLAALPPPGGALSLLVETQVREDAIALYGFLDAAERAWFRMLLTVQGVGAKVALSILGTLPVADLALAVAGGDKAMLSRAPGVGPRLAARLATELKDKVVALPVPAGTSAAAPRGDTAGDVLSALANLGYRRAEAAAAIERAQARLGPDLKEGGQKFEALIREALKELAP
jgi:Holliday junction DNA helicase RuvA